MEIAMFKAGIIGCGRIGSLFDDDSRRKTISSHAGAYSTIGEIKLVAACDLDAGRLQKCGQKWAIPSLYQDYKKMLMLMGEKLDILSICTPNSTHLDIVKEAIKTKIKVIFCEKPIADSLENADEMIRLCKEKDVFLQINHQRRFDKLHREIKNFINNGLLGKIQQVSFYYTRGIANTGSHMFDLLRFFFGDAKWIQVIYSKNKSENLEDPNIDGILKFKNGIFCTIQACDSRYFQLFELDCLGSQGRLKLKHDGRDLDFWTIREDSFGFRRLFKAPIPVKRKLPFEPMVPGVEHLIDCLQTQRKSLSSGMNGRAALELICASLKSANLDGKRIKLPLRKSRIKVKSK